MFFPKPIFFRKFGEIFFESGKFHPSAMALNEPAVVRHQRAAPGARLAPPARVPRASLALWGLAMIASFVAAAGAGTFLVAAPGVGHGAAFAREQRCPAGRIDACIYARTHARVCACKRTNRSRREMHTHTHARARPHQHKNLHTERKQHARSQLQHHSLSCRNNARGQKRELREDVDERALWRMQCMRVRLPLRVRCACACVVRSCVHLRACVFVPARAWTSVARGDARNC